CSLAVYSVLAAFALCALPTVLVVLVAFAGFALVRSPWSWGSMRSSRSLRWMRFVQPPRCMRLSKPARLQQPWHTSTLLRQSLHDGAARAKINTKPPRSPAGRWERTGAAPSFVPTKSKRGYTRCASMNGERADGRDDASVHYHRGPRRGGTHWTGLGGKTAGRLCQHRADHSLDLSLGRKNRRRRRDPAVSKIYGLGPGRAGQNGAGA